MTINVESAPFMPMLVIQRSFVYFLELSRIATVFTLISLPLPSLLTIIKDISFELMAESQTIAKQALKKLEDQLTCAICLDAFKDPKLLQCFHVYCKDCLQQLMITDRQDQLSLQCPTCRQTTLLPPATGVSGLQPAFYIHHLLEIQSALEKVRDPKEMLCGKCLKSPQIATSYCHDCGEFICAMCTTIHSQWGDFAEHEVVAIELLEQKQNQLNALKKVTLCCSSHKDVKLDLYCETCEELICLHCTINKHCTPEHKYNLVADVFDKHKADITASLQPVEKQLGIVSKTLEQLDVRLQELNDLQVSIEADIKEQIQQLQELLETRRTELIRQLQQCIQIKKKNLVAQKDEVEAVHTQLTSCLSFMKESLKTGSQGEVMKMKKGVMKQIKEMTDNIKPDILPPCEPANVKFAPLSDLTLACQQFGKLCLQHIISPEKCYGTGKSLKIANVGERATIVLYAVDNEEQPYVTPLKTLTSVLVSETTGDKVNYSMKKTEASKYEISYQATRRGRHQLHIKVEGEHIKGSPFFVTVKLPVNELSAPIKIIRGVKMPWGVAVNHRGDIIVAESNRHCVSLFSPTGKKICTFGSHGSGDGLLKIPFGVTVCDDGNILVVDHENHCIQSFSSDGKFVTAIGKKGARKLPFHGPCGISIHPHTRKIYVADEINHCIQILNPDLTFSSSFGSYGIGIGQFRWPLDVACDSAGNVYVADSNNYCIQVFTAEGKFLRKFGKQGSGNGELAYPSSISIDSDNMLYVTECNSHCVSVLTCEGEFLSCFGTQGSGPGQFSSPCGIAVDKDGVVYVSDTHNNRLQIF